MKKSILFLAISAVALTASADDSCSSCSVNFEELPYAEGTLYLSISEGENNVVLKAIEIEADSVSIPVCFCQYIGTPLSVNAFLDLNGNRQLDFDNYGRPTEPCLRDQLTPTKGTKTYVFNLVEY